MTNYDRIKQMSVDEMAEWIVGLKLVFECHALGGDAHEVLLKLNNSEKQELDEWSEEGKETYKQWLLQEVSEDITKIEHNSLCETETYKGEK